MALKFRCPHCIRKIACPDEAMGLYLACPHCEARVRVPIWADLGDLTPASIKAAQKAQIQRAKKSQASPEATPKDRDEMPVEQTESPQSSEAAPKIEREERPKRPDRPERPASPVSAGPPGRDDDEEIELIMGDDDGGLNETDDLLASLAAAGDDEGDADDMQVESAPAKKPKAAASKPKAPASKPAPTAAEEDGDEDFFVGEEVVEDDGPAEELSDSLAELARAFEDNQDAKKP